MKILRGFSVANMDGEYNVCATYNEVDADGNVTGVNKKMSFYAVESEVKSHIESIQEFIAARLEGAEE